MARKLIQLALLTAGLFLSGNALAVGECLGMVGTVQQMSVSAGGCPAIGFKVVSGVQCEVVNVGSGISGADSQCICVVGSGCFDNYKYTGGLYTNKETYDAHEPGPSTGNGDGSMHSDIRYLANDVNQVKYSATVNARLAKLNADIINDNVTTVSQKANLIISDTSVANSRLQKLINDHQQTKDLIEPLTTLVPDILESTSDILYNQTSDRATLSQIQQTIDDNHVSENQLALQFRNDTVDDIVVATNSVLDAVEAVSQKTGTAVDQLNYVTNVLNGEASDNRLFRTSTTQSISTLSSSEQARHSDLVEKISSLSGSGGSGGGGQLPVDALNEIGSKIEYAMGENMDDMDEVNANLRSIQRNQNNVSLALNPLSELSQINFRLGWLSDQQSSQSQGLSMQLGMQLSGIQSAIQNDSIPLQNLVGSTDALGTKLDNIYAALDTMQSTDDDTETNAKLDQLITAVESIEFTDDDTETNERLAAVINNTAATNTSVNNTAASLGQKLDSIQTAIENSGGTGGTDDDTETNEKLDELITGAALINDNLVTNGMNNEHAIQQTTNAVNALGGKLDGIGDGIEGLSDSFTAGTAVLGEKLDGIGDGIEGLADSLSPGTGQLTGPEKCEGPHCWKSKSWIDTSYEEGMKTVWDEHMLAFNTSSMKSYLEGLFPSIGGVGGLEPAQFCFDMGFVNFGCFTLTIPPYVIAFIRICLLISAGFYCQRLVFGGA